MLEIRDAHGDDRPTIRAAKLGVAVCALLVALSALTSNARTEPQLGVVAPAAQPPAAEQPAAQPPAAEPRGFIDAFGRFIGESAAKLDSQIKSTNEALGSLGSQTTDAAKDVAKDAVDTARDVAKDAVGTAKDAAGALIALPSARIVTGRERCATAANGAPDCRTAADAACRGKGFAAGRSLDTQSTQKCPARVWLSGRPPQDGDCQLETFVTRAVCQ
jgi:hypothetical protein